jgi:membrane-associated phospholipid phosphatase
VEHAARRYSRAGEHAACWLALGLAGALIDWSISDRRQRWLRGVRVVAASYAANYAVKLAVRRPRPELDGLPPLSPVVSSLSFPSAHATTSFAAARAYAGLLPAGPLYAAATLFAFTRPYLGVHYPSDALAGAALGTLLASRWPGSRAAAADGPAAAAAADSSSAAAAGQGSSAVTVADGSSAHAAADGSSAYAAPDSRPTARGHEGQR